MKSLEGLSEKEKNRRLKISAARKKAIAAKRKAGLKKYWKRRRKEREEREKKEKKEKEKLRRQKEKERLKAKKKKKSGRRKKPGPKVSRYKRYKRLLEKKNRIDKRRIHKPPFKYKIVLCRNGSQVRFIGKYRTSQEAYEEFNKQKELSDSVVFPRSYRIDKKFENSLDECVMIEKTDDGPSMLRNEYGKLVEQRTNIEGWEVVDKFKMNIEETFWVFGYDNRSDRKTFMWIYNEMIIRDGFGPYEFRRVFTYRNKFLVRYDDGSIGIVICKSERDAVDVYNEIQRRAKADKHKQIIFIGDKSDNIKIENELISVTGWTAKKVQMRNTTYYTTKK